MFRSLINYLHIHIDAFVDFNMLIIVSIVATFDIG